MPRLAISTAATTALVLVAVASYFAGKSEGESFGRRHGRIAGQLEFVELLRNELGYTTDSQSRHEFREHVRDVKHVSVYVIEINGTRTLALWE